MSNPYFQFKQFTIWHDKCAMKVGTDGVLLGAWTNVEKAKNVLDIGTGTGLVSLMIAQRCDADITAIEIDKEAASQAAKNIDLSPWKERFNIVNIDFKLFNSNQKFDVIVSNPPYFSGSLLSPNSQRSIARHTSELTYNELINRASLLLSKEGEFSVVIPSEVSELIKQIAKDNGMYTVRQTDVCPKPDSNPKRCLLSFSFTNKGECVHDSFIIELARHQYSEAYIELTKEYYLKM